MLTLIVAVLFGLVIALFATQNTNGADISIAQYQFTRVPLYIIMIGSLLAGLLIAWIMSLLNGISSFFTMKGKDHTIHSADKSIERLEEQVHQLEKENAELKGRAYKSDTHKSVVTEDDTTSHHPNIFQRIKYSFR